MIHSALIDWSDNPVITSLDSISTPIDLIQFPTITVCKDETKEQPDNWAYLENLLNLLSFHCFQITDCFSSETLRKDFRYVIRNVVDQFELNIKEDNEAIHQLFEASYGTYIWYSYILFQCSVKEIM